MADVVKFTKAAPAWSLTWNAGWVTAVGFLGSSGRLAAGNEHGEVMVWRLPGDAGAAAPKPYRRLDGHGNGVSRLVAADGRWLISASYDHTVRYWDLDAKASGSAAVVLNARTREEAAQRRGRKVPEPVEAKVETQGPARVLKGHKEWVVALGLSGDGKRLISGDDGGQVVVWDREKGSEVRRWAVKGWAYAAALAPGGEQAVVTERLPLVFDSGRHAGVKLWDVAKGAVERDLSAAFKGMHLAGAAYRPDGKVLALGRGGEVDGMNGKVTLVDPSTGKKVRELAPGHLNGLTDLAFHPDGVHLASCGRDTQVRVWNSEDGKLVQELGQGRGGQFKDWLHAVAFSADGRWLAAADMAGAVQVWRVGAAQG